MKVLVSVVILQIVIRHICSLPQGAPTKVCETMLPFHGGGIQRKSLSTTPFGILPVPNENGFHVTIRSTFGVPFEGFMLQARSPNRDLLGTFQSAKASHTLDCASNADTITHSDTSRRESFEVDWTRPVDYDGVVIFNATVAQSYGEFWVGIESPHVRAGSQADNNDLGFTTWRPRTSTPPHYSPESVQEASTEFDPFYSGCAQTKLCFGSPAGCVASNNCKAVVAVSVFGDKYDFELKATGNPKWVGVGLSSDTKMGDDSVIECVRRSSSVVAFMSWTTAPPDSYGAKRLDNPQLGIQLLNSSAVDDTLFCKVRREAITTVNNQQFNLMNSKYFILIAAGKEAAATSVGFHDLTFLASGEQQFLSDVSSVRAASKLLLRLHGAFMIAAWIGTASLGILLARYYRKTWVGSQLCGKDLWFAWHRMFMVLTWCLTMAGFVLIWLELKAWSNETPHAISGTVTTIICFIQPIGAYFRPHPGTSKRPIFDWLHWFAGNAAHIIAVLTLFFAVRLTKAELPDFVDWILVAFVAFHVLVHIVLSVMGCIAERASERRITSFPMKEMGSPNGSGRSSAFMEKNADSPYSNFRRCLLAIYIFLNLAIVIALIVIAALAPIEESWDSFKTTMMGTT